MPSHKGIKWNSVGLAAFVCGSGTHGMVEIPRQGRVFIFPLRKFHSLKPVKNCGNWSTTSVHTRLLSWIGPPFRGGMTWWQSPLESTRPFLPSVTSLPPQVCVADHLQTLFIHAQCVDLFTAILASTSKRGEAGCGFLSRLFTPTSF